MAGRWPLERLRYLVAALMAVESPANNSNWREEEELVNFFPNLPNCPNDKKKRKQDTQYSKECCFWRYRNLLDVNTGSAFLILLPSKKTKHAQQQQQQQQHRERRHLNGFNGLTTHLFRLKFTHALWLLHFYRIRIIKKYWNPLATGCWKVTHLQLTDIISHHLSVND